MLKGILEKMKNSLIKISKHLFKINLEPKTDWLSIKLERNRNSSLRQHELCYHLSLKNLRRVIEPHQNHPP